MDKEITKRTVKINIKEFHGDTMPAVVVADITKSLGPTFKDGKVAKGITEKEEDELLPRILETSKNDPKWHDKVKEFWNSLSQPVKYSTGLVLDISTDSKGNPTNPKDYILWKRAMVSPNVAKNRDEARSSGRYWFYIHDEEEVKLKTSKSIKDVTTATQLYMEHEDKEDTVDMLLWMFNENPNLYADLLEKKNELFERVQSSPDKFIEYCKDSNLPIKAEIYAMLHAGIISKAGDTMHYGDYILGDNMTKAVIFFKDAKNSQVVNNMKAELKKARR